MSMSKVKEALMTTAVVLITVYALNKLPVTKRFVQTALTGS